MSHKLAIFGGGRVGAALAAEMPGVPVVRRGDDADCAIALVCWPAQALRGFAAMHPRGARGKTVAFANGAWAVADGMDRAGVCYVRAVNRGDRAKPGRKGWRVGDAWVAAAMRAAGCGVICTRTPHDHRAYVWAKCLYIIPLAIACAEHNVAAREAAKTETWAEWYDRVLEAMYEDGIAETAITVEDCHARFLVERSPRGWRPSSSFEEVCYFKRRLGCAD